MLFLFIARSINTEIHRYPTLNLIPRKALRRRARISKGLQRLRQRLEPTLQTHRMGIEDATLAGAMPLDDGLASEPAGSEQRIAPRFTLLIRAAKLVSPNGEFVCVIRDVSESGVSVRLFHDLPQGQPLELHMPGGGAYEMEPVWTRDNEAGFQFAESVDVGRLIYEAGEYPKRGLRLGVCFPIQISTLTQRCEGMVVNLSQQGARFECDGLFAIDQSLRIETIEPTPEFAEVRAKVRWRRERDFGVVFDDTFTLGDFARLAARLQSPGLLEG